MPLHDWTRVPAGLFHHFHQDWSIEIARALNRGILPKGYSALVEQRAGSREGDVLAIETRQRAAENRERNGGVSVLPKPATRIVEPSTPAWFAARANRLVIRHHLGRVVAVLEIASPGNKDSQEAFQEFVEKTRSFLLSGIHVQMIDLFPPSARDPAGMHHAIWAEAPTASALAPGKDRVLASYESASGCTAYVELVGIGDRLPELPLFIAPRQSVPVPLEATYQAAWEASPEELRHAVETGILPDPNAD